MPQSQLHGFIIENDIREKVFGLSPEPNNTDTHDIPKSLNKFSDNENISIKTVGGNCICCGDIERFFSYDFSDTNTIVVIKYQQLEETKKIVDIFEIRYDEECHNFIWGTIKLDTIKKYVSLVKSIPHGTPDKYYKKTYKNLKKYMEENFNMNISINPKIDSGRQRRVQCSIGNFENKLENFITYQSTKYTGKPNIYRGQEIIELFESPKRVRNQKEKH